jgi:peptide chain release factor 1
VENLKQLKIEYDKLSQKLAAGELALDVEKLKRYSELEEIMKLIDKIERFKKNIAQNQEILKTEKDGELLALADEELKTQTRQLEELEKECRKLASPANRTNIKDVIMEIRAGVGGNEAALFAQEMFRMYSRYAEIKGWKLTILEESRSELKGLKEIVLEISGKDAYKQLKHESGVHRVQRVPETERSGRLHTSSASVVVLPKAQKIDVEINPSDIKLETFRSSGPGGQNVNKVSTAVRITHLPTGMSAASQSSKSQAQNRENAMTLLRSRLLEQKIREQEAKIKTERKQQIGTGDRSEKIRTYNFPQDRVTDHRINKSWHGIGNIMAGGVDKIFDELNEKL